MISIHGPRVGADASKLQSLKLLPISIHGPRVGADGLSVSGVSDVKEFQSTAPVWGPTLRFGLQSLLPRYFNPRPPCGGRPAVAADDLVIGDISIHGPRVGADAKPGLTQVTIGISIHGPRVGADLTRFVIFTGLSNFNPRPPCGGRRLPASLQAPPLRFQSTAPVWGPTMAKIADCTCDDISIHGPRVGADFQYLKGIKDPGISIHGPRVGADDEMILAVSLTLISIHGPRVGADSKC